MADAEMLDAQRLVGGIELGGTKSIIVLARGKYIVAQQRFPTQDPGHTLAVLSAQLDAWVGEHGRPEALGIGSFGPIGLDPRRPDYGFITSTPKSGWAGTDLIGHFASRIDAPIGFDTDVAAAALAEYRWGAAQGCDVAIYLTIGTGLGAGVLVNGAPVHGLIHPEFGHVRIRRLLNDGFAGICPFHGDCLEGLVSGPAIAARAGKPGAEIQDDDPLWTAVTDELAEAMAMLMVTLSPQRIVIGGGVLQNRPALFSGIHRRTADILAGYLEGIGVEQIARIIVRPGLADQAGPLGAVALAYSALG